MTDYWYQVSQWANGDMESIWEEEGVVLTDKEFNDKCVWMSRKRWWKAFNWFESRIQNGPTKGFYDDMMGEQLYFFE